MPLKFFGNDKAVLAAAFLMAVVALGLSLSTVAMDVSNIPGATLVKGEKGLQGPLGPPGLPGEEMVQRFFSQGVAYDYQNGRAVQMSTSVSPGLAISVVTIESPNTTGEWRVGLFDIAETLGGFPDLSVDPIVLGSTMTWGGIIQKIFVQYLTAGDLLTMKFDNDGYDGNGKSMDFTLLFRMTKQ